MSKDEDVAATRCMLQNWDAVASGADAVLQAELHTADAIRVRPNEPAIVDKEVIQSWLQPRRR